MAKLKTELKMFLIGLFTPFICVYEVIHLVKICIATIRTIVVIAKRRNKKIVKISVKYDQKENRLVFDVVTKEK